MSKPTDEQIKEFWEGCGWRIVKDIGLWYSVDPLTNKRYMGTSDKKCFNLLYPSIDLNNLFKYAVPKLQDKGYWVELFSFEHKGYKVRICPIFGEVDIPIAISKDDDPALALFWAIYEAVK